MTGELWADLVTSAVQGTARRPGDARRWAAALGVETADAGAGDAAERLLAVAALAAAARRAGALPGAAAPPHPRALPEPRPVAHGLVHWHRLIAAEHRDLLPDLLAGLREHGLVLPAWLAPEVLDRALAERGGDAAWDAVAAAGATGAWLVQTQDRWAALRPLLAGPGPVAGPAGRAAAAAGTGTTAVSADPAAGAGVEAGGGAADAGAPTTVGGTAASGWETGSTAERVGWLRRALRAGAVGAAPIVAETLTTTTEPAEVREQVVVLLGDPALRSVVDATVGQTGHTAVELLDRALDDRAQGVRRAAALALVPLTATPYAARMAARARAWVRAETRGGGLLGRTGTSLVVTVPETLDPATLRDQVGGRTPLTWRGMHRGERSTWLADVVAGTPLQTWADLGAPAAILALPATEGWHEPLVRGWIERTVVEQDRAWADALLTAGAAVPGAERLVALASPELARRVVVDRLALQADVAARFVAALPQPWPPEILDGVLARLVGPPGPDYPFAWHGLVESIGHTGPLSMMGRVISAAAHETPLAAPLRRAAERMRLRLRLAEAIAEASRTARAASGIPDGGAAAPLPGPADPPRTDPPPPRTDSPPATRGDLT